MNLEQVIRSTLSESGDMEGRLDQLVRAGLMPSNILPVLKRAIAKMHGGMTLQGAERDAMNMFINSMMFIVLGDDTVFNKARAGAKSYATEAKEKQEYDYEGDMAMSQLKSIIANSQRMHDSMSEDTNLPEWVQSKITLAEDYISTAANYLQGEVSEAVGDYTVKTVSPADAWKKHTGQKTSKSKVPVDPKTGKTLYQKVTSEEVEDLEETAKIVAHLQKRYGDNIRKSHVASAAKDFGVDASKLSKAVRKKLGKSMLDEEEQIDEISKKTLASYSDKAVRQTYGNQPHGKDALRKRTNREQGVKAAYNKFFGYKTKVPATEETQIDELSRGMLSRYQAASKEEGRKNRLSPSGASSKVTKRTQGADLAMRKSLSAVTGKKLAKVPATNEEVENIDELSKATMGRYVNKAAERMSTQGVTAGLKIAADEKSKKNFDNIKKRQKGIATAVKKLTKESRKADAGADIAAIKQMNESYKTTFDAALQEYGIKSPSELDEEKRKEFFNFVDQNYKKGDN